MLRLIGIKFAMCPQRSDSDGNLAWRTLPGLLHTPPRPTVGRRSIDSPYMLLVVDVKPAQRKLALKAQDGSFGLDLLNVPRSDIPAVTHVDYSARIQTVHRETNPHYHTLLQAFKAKAGCLVIVNTVSTYVASQSYARPQTLSAASWAPTSTASPSGILSCGRKHRSRRSRSKSTRVRSIWIDG